MSLPSIRSRLSDSGVFEPLLRWHVHDSPSVRIGGGVGSLRSFAVAELLENTRVPLLAITADSDAAAHLVGDLAEIRGTTGGVHLLGSTGYKPYDDEQVHDPIRLSARADVLAAISAGESASTAWSAQSPIWPPTTAPSSTCLESRV